MLVVHSWSDGTYWCWTVCQGQLSWSLMLLASLAHSVFFIGATRTEVEEWQKMGKDRENSSCEWMSGGREVGMGAGLQSIYSVLN